MSHSRNHHYDASLDLWFGRNHAAEELNKAAAADYAIRVEAIARQLGAQRRPRLTVITGGLDRE